MDPKPGSATFEVTQEIGGLVVRFDQDNGETFDTTVKEVIDLLLSKSLSFRDIRDVLSRVEGEIREMKPRRDQ